MSFVNSENLPNPRAVHGIDENRLHEMRLFLQGAVYCWCKNRKDEPFAARDLLGGDNYFWEATPMETLFLYYRNGNDDNNEYAVEEAGKAAGRLLYQMLRDDKREFETWVEYTRMYRWTGEEDNSKSFSQH
ncbi:MAG: hypothetical protein IKM85_09895 [Bacteroidales bacterium]|nr:hypothetical protein [Bacteroidales bacterium]